MTNMTSIQIHHFEQSLIGLTRCPFRHVLFSFSGICGLLILSDIIAKNGNNVICFADKGGAAQIPFLVT